MTLTKLKSGDYAGWAGNKYVRIYKRAHGGWCAEIQTSKGIPVASEGYFTTSLPTVNDAKKWVSKKINGDQNPERSVATGDDSSTKADKQKK